MTYTLPLALVAIVATACCPTAAAPARRPSILSSGEEVTISVEPIGHWHVQTSKSLSIRVRGHDGTPRPSQPLEVALVRAGGGMETHHVAPGDVEDRHDGTYALSLTPTDVGPYALSATVRSGERTSVSPPVAFEIARDGEEGIRVDTTGSSFVYQIRYEWRPGRIEAAAKPVELAFELLRGLEQGDQIDWKQPWKNRFDPVVDARDVVVSIESNGVHVELHPAYRGRGVYVAERAFAPAEVGAGRDYAVRCAFVDPKNGARVTHAAAYRLHATSPSSSAPGGRESPGS